MKISELIAELKIAETHHGDIEVMIDGYSALHGIEDAGVDVDESGFIIWIGEVREEDE